MVKSFKYINDLIDKKRVESLNKVKELIFNCENQEFDKHNLYKECLINDILQLDKEIENLKKMFDKLVSLSDRLYVEKDDCNHYVVREKK